MSEPIQQSLPWDEAAAPLPVHPYTGFTYREMQGPFAILRNDAGEKRVAEPVGLRALMANLHRFQPDDALRTELSKIEDLFAIKPEEVFPDLALANVA